MPESSADPLARARKCESLVLRRAHAVSQQALAAAVGIDPSTMSRLLSEHLPKLARVMAHAGLKVVDERRGCFDPEYVDALMVLAKQHVQQARPPGELDWDD